MQKSLTRRPLSKAEWSLFLAPLGVLVALGIYSVLRPLFPHQISVNKGSIESLTYSPDGKQLAVVSFRTRPTKKGDGTWLSLYDTKSSSQLWQQAVGDWAGTPRYSQDGKIFGLESDTNGGGLTTFRDSQSRQTLYRLPFTEGFVFSRDGRMVLAQTSSHLTLYDEMGKPRHTFSKTLQEYPTAVWTWSPSQKLVAALEINPQDKNTFRPCIWDVNGKVLAHLPIRKWAFLRFAGDDRYLILGEENKTVWSDNSLQLWDWRKGKKIQELSQGAHHYFRVSHDGKALVAIRNFYNFQKDSPIIKGGELRRLSLPDNKVLWSKKKQSATGFYFTDSQDRLLLSKESLQNKSPHALLWNCETGEILQTYEDVSAMAISPDGATVAIGKGDGTVHLYNTSRFLK